MVLYTLAMPPSVRTSLTGIALLLILGITSACGNPPKTLDVAIGLWEETLNPLVTDVQGSRYIASIIYESLFRIDDEGNVVPWLTKEWEWNSSGTVLTLFLRSGIRLHDGSMLDSRVVIESLERAVNSLMSDSHGSYSSVPYILGGLTTFNEIDDVTFSIRLNMPHPSLLYTLATPMLTPIMGREPVVVSGREFRPGTGQYKLSRFSAGEGKLILERFGQYWGDPPQSERIRFTAVSGAEDALELLRKNQVDLSLVISVSHINDVNSNESMALVTGPHVNYLVIGVNNQRPPFNIIEARRALAYGIDREKLVEEYYKGAAAPTRSFIVEDLIPKVVSPAASDYDPVRARELIESHVPAEHRIVRMLFPPSQSPGKEHWLFDSLRFMLEPLGLELQPRYTDDFDEYATLVGQRDWDISLDGMVTDNHDLFEFLYILYAQPSPLGGTGLFGLEANQLYELLERSRSILDRAERVSTYEEVLDIIAREIPCVPLCTRAHFLIRSSEVDEFELGTDISRIFSDVRKRDWR